MDHTRSVFHARDTQLHKDSFVLHCAIGVRQDSCRSTFTGVQSSCSWLSGAQGGDQAFGRHGCVRRGCSAPAPCVYGISQLSAVKKEVGIGISLDQPGMFQDMLYVYSIYTLDTRDIDKIYHRYTIVSTVTTGLIIQICHRQTWHKRT